MVPNADLTLGGRPLTGERPMTVLSPRQVRLMTVEDWVQHPEADQYELVDGVLRARSAGENLHEITTPRLASLLGQHLDAHGVEGAAFGSRAKYRVRSRRGIMPDVSVIMGTKLDQ